MIPLSEFTYELPQHAIATVSVEPRDSAKLLVSRSVEEVVESTIASLQSFLAPGDLVVVNNTKVLPARIPIVRTSGGRGEVFLLHRIDDGLWNALVKPSAKIPIGEKVLTEIDVNRAECKIEIGEDNGEGHRVIRFLDANEHDVIHAAGRAPLPPYLGDVDIPLDRYQTMFARDEESVAAPTAGLHFTPGVKESLQSSGIEINEVTLHVGVGTFRPIMTDNIEDHVMHSERYDVPANVWENIRATKQKGGRIVAVGTTSLRTLESVAQTNQLSGDTNLFCYGDFPFQVADLLLTNFHQPQSSLLVLLDSFIGPRWRELYAYALSNDFRFLSFGDAMLVAKH
ncbi:MAG TPA: tRNA preQ1(34) S-adenosylmethionine ribosyltransferase-isomerase QueA [Acidimicrobiia bacterium]|nr:tRNA preQ1(34) S-adenosylmethionine ribosyltransferase-isomerase QueA [Acidimicrobiia bacterium]